jgi:hypothetical protein
MLHTKKESKFFWFYACFVTLNDCTISQNFLVSIKNPQEHLPLTLSLTNVNETVNITRTPPVFPLNIFIGLFIKSIINVCLPVVFLCLTAGATNEKAGSLQDFNLEKEVNPLYSDIIQSRTPKYEPTILAKCKKKKQIINYKGDSTGTRSRPAESLVLMAKHALMQAQIQDQVNLILRRAWTPSV